MTQYCAHTSSVMCCFWSSLTLFIFRSADVNCKKCQVLVLNYATKIVPRTTSQLNLYFNSRYPFSRKARHYELHSLLRLFPQNELINLSETIIAAIQDIVNKFNINNYSAHFTDPIEHAPLISRWREVVRHAFKLGFEFNRDVLRLVSGKPSVELTLKVVKLAKLWMNFTVTYCERGRGLRPKWAAQVTSEAPFSVLRETYYSCFFRGWTFLEQRAILKSHATLPTRSSRSSKSQQDNAFATLSVPWIRSI